ncbi:MAG: MFS transporter [Thermocladium sp.]|jgi:MFS family permease
MSALRALGVMIPFLLSAYSVFSIIYVIPQLSSALGVSVSLISLAVTLSFIGGALGGVVIGVVADRWGRRIGLGLSILIFGLATLITSLITNIWELYLLWFLVGFGVNSENGISYAVIVEVWRSNQGLLGGIMQGLYPVGMLLDAATSFLVRSWRPYMAIIGVVSLIGSLSSLLAIPETRFQSLRTSYWEIFSPQYRSITALGTVLVASAFMFTVPFISLVPTYILIRGFSGITYEATLIALSTLMAVSFGLAGYIMDRWGSFKTTITLSTMALASSLLFLVINLMNWGLIIVPIALGYFASSFFAYMGILMGRLYPPQVRATGTNFTFLLGRIMAGVGVALAASISSNLGIGMSFLMLASSIAAIASSVPLLRGR